LPQLVLLLLGELILDPRHERELRSLDVALYGQYLIDLREESAFVNRRALEQSLQLLRLSAHLELEIDELHLSVAHCTLHRRTLSLRKRYCAKGSSLGVIALHGFERTCVEGTFVLMMMTPFSAVPPYAATAAGPFKISTCSMSAGLMQNGFPASRAGPCPRPPRCANAIGVTQIVRPSASVILFIVSSLVLDGIARCAVKD
jgi:hypothetical protein